MNRISLFKKRNIKKKFNHHRTANEPKAPLRALTYKDISEIKFELHNKLMSSPMTLTKAITYLTADEKRLYLAVENLTVEIYHLKPFLTRNELDLISSLKGHKTKITGIVYSGDILITGSSDGRFYIWDLKKLPREELEPLWTIKHDMWIDIIHFSDKLLFIGNLDFIFIHRIYTKSRKKPPLLIRKLLIGHGWIYKINLCNGFLFSGSNEKFFKYYDIRDLNKKKYIEEPIEPIFCEVDHVAYCARLYKGIVYSGLANGSILAWSFAPKKLKKLYTFFGHTEAVLELVGHKNKLISGSNDRTIRVWDLNQNPKKNLIRTFYGFGLKTTWLTIIKNRIITAMNPKVLFQSEISNRPNISPETDLEVLVEEKVDRDPILFLCTSPDKSKIYMSDRIGFINEWSIDKNKMYLPPVPIRKFKAHEKSVFQLRFLNKFLYSTSNDGSFRKWDMNKELNKRNMGTGIFTPRAIEPERVFNCTKDVYGIIGTEEEIFVGDGGGYIHCWKIKSQEKEPLKNWKAHKGSIYKLAFGFNRLFSGSEDCIIISWTISNILSDDAIIPEKTFEEHQGWIFMLKFKENLLFSGSKDHSARIWDISSRKAMNKPSVKVLDGHNSVVNFMSIEENLAFTGTGNGWIFVWDINKPQRIDTTPLKFFRAHQVTTFGYETFKRKTLSVCWGANLKIFAPLDSTDLTKALYKDDIMVLNFHQILSVNLSEEEYKMDVKGILLYLRQNSPVETMKRYPILEVLALRFNSEIIDFYFELLGFPSYPFLSKIITLHSTLEIKKKSDSKSTGYFERKKYASQVRLTLDYIIDWVANQMKINQTKTEELLAQEPQYLFQLLIEYGLTSGSARNLAVLCLKQEILETRGQLKYLGKVIMPIKSLAMRFSCFILSELRPIPIKPEKLRIWNTRFKMDIENGSPHSVMLFRMIQMLSDSQRKEFDEIISYKWKKLRLLIRAHAVLFGIQVSLFNWYLYGSHDKIIIIPLVILNFYFASYEIKSWISGRNYIRSMFNWADLLLIFWVFVIVALNALFTESQVRYLSVCNFFCSTLINVRGITYLRAFDSLRYLIEMVLKIYSDIGAFLIIMFIFGLIYSVSLISVDAILQKDDSIYLEKLKIAANLALGTWDDIPEDWTSWDWLVFLVSTITFSVILLNLIIAIVSRTFEEFYMDQVGIDREIKLSLIVEIDDVLRIGKLKSDPKKWKKQAIGFQAIEKMQDMLSLEKLKDEIITSEERLVQVLDKKLEKTEIRLKEQGEALEGKMMGALKRIEEKLSGSFS